jgi:signal transduction histidine kinase
VDKDNDNLLDALESIKDLLEKGESKLSAARESLEKAKPKKRQSKPRYPVSDEPVVPVLDDIVSPAIEDDDEDILLVDDIPELDVVADSEEENSPGSHPPLENYSTNEILAQIDDLRDTLAKELHDTLINTLVSIEADFKTSLHEHIQQIKDQIERNRKD